ncbi:MAG: hypothetical protein IJV27_06835, partial [Prevotella sp.]|nr:hypothetical protein [Prevotella sp.]
MTKKKWWKWVGLLMAMAVVLSLAIPTALADDTHTRTGFPKVDPSNPDAALTVTFHQSAARGILPLVNEFRSGDEAYYWDQDDTSIVRKDSLLYFQYDYDLEQIAIQRAVEYAARDAFGINRGESAHNRPTGEKYTTAVLDNGASSYGENLCSGNRLDSPSSALELWKESDEPYSGQGHRRLILNDSDGHNAIGVGCVEYKGIYYWAMEFGPVRANESTASLDNAYQVCIEVPARYESIGEPLDTRAIRETGACGYQNRDDIQWI